MSKKMKYEAKNYNNKEYKKKYYEENKEKILERNKINRVKNKDKIKNQKYQYYLNNKDKILKRTKEYAINNKEKRSLKAKNRNLKNKLDTIEHYGKECKCCRESLHYFLSIDHIYGKGNEHRKKIGSSSSFNIWLRLNNYPKDKFQLLCFNCNMAKGFYGCCPHDINFDLKNTQSKSKVAIRSREIKLEVINYYGGRCECCGITNIKFLAMDHINGGGRQHKKSINNTNIYKWIKKNNFPNIFRVLCHNCNFGRYINRGICPHEGMLKYEE